MLLGVHVVTDQSLKGIQDKISTPAAPTERKYATTSE
jgi:hypothetical protein